jgi:hypothetical protein
MELVRKRILVVSRKKGAPLTKDEAIGVLHETLNDYFTSKGYQGVGRAEVDVWRNRIAKHGNHGPSLLTEVNATSDNVQLSAEANAYLNDIVSIADQAGYHGFEWLQSQLSYIESSASVSLSGVDLEAVFTVSSVTLSSAAYWPSFSDEWYRMCGIELVCDGSGGGGAVIQRVSMGWRVLATDVVCAVGGFLYGGPLGAFFTAAIGSSAAIIAEL